MDKLVPFSPLIYFTSIQNGDVFKSKTHKCQRKGKEGVMNLNLGYKYYFETPVMNRNLNSDYETLVYNINMDVNLRL